MVVIPSQRSYCRGELYQRGLSTRFSGEWVVVLSGAWECDSCSGNVFAQSLNFGGI